jgi:hypothetical protein
VRDFLSAAYTVIPPRVGADSLGPSMALACSQLQRMSQRQCALVSLQTTMPAPRSGIVVPEWEPSGEHTHDLVRSELGDSFSYRMAKSGPASPPLNGFQDSRAMLLADRLDCPPIQVMAYSTLPSTGHEVARAARVCSKRSR